MKRILIDGNKPQYKAALHTHSTLCDGDVTPEEVKAGYKAQGYSILAFTNHEIMYDMTYLSDENFLILNGYEIATNNDNNSDPLENKKSAHFCLIAKTPDLRVQACYHPDYDWLHSDKQKAAVQSVPLTHERKHTVEDFNYMIETANKLGYLVAYNHPAWSLHSGADYLGLKGLWAMEWHNTGSAIGGYEEGTHYYDDMLLNGIRLHTLATDDFHRWKEAFGGWVNVNTDDFTYAGVIKALETGAFYSSTGPSVLNAYLDGKKLVVTANAGDELLVRGFARDVVLQTEYKEVGDNRVFEADLSKFQWDYFRFEIRESSTGKKAVSNAVYGLHSKQKLDIIIQGGQSNAEGIGRGTVEQGFIPTERIIYMDAEKTVEHLPEGVKVEFFDKPYRFSIAKERGVGDRQTGDFALTFAEEYVKSGMLQEDRNVLIVRCGIGGTGFKKGNWRIGDPLYKKLLEMVDYALGLNEDNRVVAFLWHQGEHDAFEGNDSETFEKQLGDLVLGVRTHYGANLPFIAGDFVQEWKSENMEKCVPIVEKIRLAASGKNSAFVETDGLLSNNQQNGDGDNIHFSRQSLHELGKRYFKKYKEIKEREN